MPNSGECVITFPVGGVFGVARLATKLNELLKRGQIGPWHVGHWIDFKHTAIRIKFLTVTDGDIAQRACVDAYCGTAASTNSDDRWRIRGPVGQIRRKLRM
jgi:hypothetical protein